MNPAYRYAARSAGAVLAGLALWLAFPGTNLWWLAPIAIAALSAVTVEVGARCAFGLGLLAGLAFFVPVLSWSGIYVGAFPWLALAFFEALYVALMCALVAFVTRRLRPRLGNGVYAVVPLAWVVQEWVRGSVPFGGFPWARLAFSQADGPLVNLAQFVGAPGVSAAVATLGVLILIAARTSTWTRRAGALSLAGVILVGAHLAVPNVDGPLVSVAMVQGNVPRPGLDFNAERRAVLDNHVRGTEAVAQRLDAEEKAGRSGADLSVVLWPENSSDIDPLRNPDARAQIQRAVDAVNVPLLVGAVLREPADNLTNASLFYRPGANPQTPERYVKNHPVPFAEYIPYRDFFRIFSDKVDLVSRDFVPGTRLGKFRVTAPGGPTYWLVPSICFEVAYDDLTRETVTQVGREPSLLVVQTNNATFGYSPEAEQQFAISRLRAIEHGRAVAHVSTVGVSGFIAPDGSVTHKTRLFTPAQSVAEVSVSSEPTVSDRIGTLPQWLALGGLAAYVIGALVVGRRVKVKADLVTNS